MLELKGIKNWMTERHKIFLKKEAGEPWPWTKDPILKEWSFTNPFRENDRVTRWIKANWRDPYLEHPNLWFAMCLARMVNWPPTLEVLGFPTGDWEVVAKLYAAKMNALAAKGQKVYTGAYMIRGGPRGMDKPTWTCQHVLMGPWKRRAEILSYLTNIPPKERELREFCDWLTQFDAWGGFMAYEVACDLRWTPWLNQASDIYTWAHAGPGAVRGLNRVHGRPVDHPLGQAQAVAEIRELMTSLNGVERAFPDITLEMRDIEHSLCEFDKYMRVANGEGTPRSRYRPPSS